MQAVDLLSKLLIFDPKQRITVNDALSHPFFMTLHDPLDEPSCLTSFDLPYSVESLDVPRLKALFLGEMQVR